MQDRDQNQRQTTSQGKDNYDQEKSQFLKNAERTFDHFVQENGTAPVATGIVNIDESGNSNSSWLNHTPELNDISPMLAKSAAFDFQQDVATQDIEIYDAKGSKGGDQTTSRKGDRELESTRS
jgi:type II secretory pathway pseudopilin PulG